jgi:DNA-binding MarR family transcriptional regulator
MFALIRSLEHDAEPVTVARLAALTGLTETGVRRLTKPLLARRLIVRAEVPGGRREDRLFVADMEAARELARVLAEAGDCVRSDGRRTTSIAPASAPTA